MTDEPNSADAARRRAVQARDRARQLQAHLAAVHQGAEELHGSSDADLVGAAQHAERASQRLRMALIASAEAHERAAGALEEEARRHGDPDGTRTARAANHREGAEKDRLRADTIEFPPAWGRLTPRGPVTPSG
jgi:hypothetical protein